MVFQNYALYPHMTVRSNLAYPLKVRGTDRETIERRVAAIAESLGLTPLLDRQPAQLSGGQRQRVALGRAMVRTPRAFLLDEPLSNLDPGLRTQARAELRRLHRVLGATIVHVTHDQEEAMTLGDRIAVMRDGVVEQVASPAEVYARPANAFVARFIGAPAMNFVPAALAGVEAPATAVVGVRPQDVLLGTSGTLRATVDLVEPRGHDAVIHLRLDGEAAPSLLAVTGPAPPATGSVVFVSFPSHRLHVFDGHDGARLPTRTGVGENR
jgi:ABC-type sugar transport system ATPase subunit